MSESLSHRSSFESDESKQELKRDFNRLAEELSQHPEGFSFPGIDEEELKKLKAVDEQHPGFVTPIEDLLSQMNNGIKIVLGEHPESGNVFVLPLSSDDVRNDSLLPRFLKAAPDMDVPLRSLILTQKALHELEQNPKE